ncbi:hypothetical protein SANTM175S_03623 [Streptomyces antimycoticus]
MQWLGAAGVFLPGLVTIVVAWLGARLVLSDVITPGELVAFYGASVFLVIPVSTATEAVESISQAHVGAGRICRFLSLVPDPPPPDDPLVLPPGALSLEDRATGIEAPAGRLTAVATSGEHGSRTAARITRYGPPTPVDGTRLAGVPLDRIALPELRRRLVLCSHADILFSSRSGPNSPATGPVPTRSCVRRCTRPPPRMWSRRCRTGWTTPSSRAAARCPADSGSG